MINFEFILFCFRYERLALNLKGGNMKMQSTSNSLETKELNQDWFGNGHIENEYYLQSLELKMKELWHKYVQRIDQHGHDEIAGFIKNEYFGLYRNYRLHRDWMQTISDHRKTG